MRLNHARASLFVLAALAAALLVPSLASAASNLEDVWCTSSSACVAVGASDSESGSSNVQVKTWNGTAWAAQEVTVPEGAVTSELAGVACSSASDCTAVGSKVGEEEVTESLVMKWDGTDWEPETPPIPSGAKASKLTQVKCPSASVCMAVGFYIDASEVRKSLSMRWDGSTWTLKTVPVPSGAGLSELVSVSCTTTSDCVAVGSFINSNEVTKTLATVWNGTSWSIVETPEPSGAELSQLEDVSCRPSEACTAVGQYFDATGDQKTLALRRNTAGEWSLQSTPNPAGALSRFLTAVSCPAATTCRALGVIEQGRKEVPIALSWNGTSWSEQPIDTEALGAAAINLTGVFCLSASDCHASGSVNYGRSTARRNTAFHYNGTAWLVTEEGEFEREWALRDVSDATSELKAVSCPEALRCVAVGTLRDDSGIEKTQVATWKGGSWSTAPGPVPAPAQTSELSGVSCVAASECWAVGSFEEEDGTREALAMRWNGSAWSIQALPTPADALGTKLSAIDCTSASACTAVGSYVDGSGEQEPLAMTFNGAEWSAALLELASTVPANTWLTAVSCSSASACLAVGTTVDPFGHEASVALARSGSSWSELETPTLEGNAPNWMTGLSCPSAAQCIVVGGYRDEEGEELPFAVSWDGSDWEPMQMPALQAEQATGLAAISCGGASSCMAVGAQPGDSTQPPLTLAWDGSSSWEPERPGEYSPGASGIELRAISCAMSSECQATGAASYGGFAAKNIALAYDEGSWSPADILSRGGSLRGVSCVSAVSCMAVGDSVLPAGDPARAWSLDDGGWTSSQTADVSGAFLSEVSCVEEEDCLAVGRYGAWPFKPLVERWDGEKWNATLTMPSPSGRSSNLEAVSCPTASWCVATGFSWAATGPGPTTPLIERYNGSGWQIATPSLPGSAVSVFLHDVSCISASLCMAAGSYTDSSGTFHGLIERWDGTSWTHASISPPSGQSYRLKGVDCTSTSACTTVGTATSHSTGVTTAITARWNGTAWTTQTVPLPDKKSGSSLGDVDCYSSTRCVAVGSATDAASESPFIAGWASGTWSVEGAPTVESASHAELESLSCPAAGDCGAVGLAQSPGALHEPLAVHTKADPASQDTPPITVNDPEPRLTPEQEEAALELMAEDPAFQAAVGTAEYEVAAIGPWTESDGEGEQTTIGAYIAISLIEPEDWSERTWPAATYPISVTGYEGGTYSEKSLEASATGILALQIRLDTEVDSEGNIVEAELIDAAPMPFDPLAPATQETGEIDIDPESAGEFNPAGGGY